MKLTSLITASSLLIAAAMPSFAQTAAPTTPAPASVPASFANVPAIQQVNTQLTAQGYSITNVTKSITGTYTITAMSVNGVARTITVNPSNGAVTDTVNTGVAANAGEGSEGMGNEGNERGERGNHNDRNDNGNERGNDNGNERGEGNEGGNDND